MRENGHVTKMVMFNGGRMVMSMRWPLMEENGLLRWPI